MKKDYEKLIKEQGDEIARELIESLEYCDSPGSLDKALEILHMLL